MRSSTVVDVVWWCEVDVKIWKHELLEGLVGETDAMGRGEKQFSPENPTFWQWTLSSLKIIYIAVVEALLRWDMAISCHVLRGIGAALWDLRMLVSMGYLALDLMRSLQSCWVNTTDRLTVKRQILSLVRSHCSSSYFDTSRVWGTMPQELLLVIALPHLLRRAE